MTHKEIEWKSFGAYPEPNRCDYPNDDEYGNAIIVRSIQREGYIKALKEIESLPKVKGYVARDENGELIAYEHKPVQDSHYWVPSRGMFIYLKKDSFPEITFDTEPVEVELLIRKR